ncbi:MAG: hypothetical protein WBV39_17180 [Rudaea sp.]
MTRIPAQTVALALALTVCGSALAGSVDAGDRAELAAVLKAPIRPVQAVQIAQSGGGVAYRNGMEVKPNGHWYEVDVLRGDATLLLRIDATTGKLLSSSPARGEDAQGAHALDGTKLTFDEAISHAERIGNGPALEAEAAGHGAQAYVDVDIIRDHGKQIAHYRVTIRDAVIHANLIGTDS